jgi:hypothetical protein
MSSMKLVPKNLPESKSAPSQTIPGSMDVAVSELVM